MNSCQNDKTLHNVAVYNRHVPEYVNRFMELELYVDTFDQLIQLLPAHANVLELGCGPGNVVKYLKSKRTDLSITGIDLAPSMIAKAQQENPGERFQVMDIRDISRMQEMFSAVIAAFCIPYMANEEVPVLFSNIKKCSTHGALLYLSCMEGPRTRSGYEPTSFTGNDTLHINYFERSYIKDLLQQQQFRIEYFTTKDYKEPDGSLTTDLFFIARMQ